MFNIQLNSMKVILIGIGLFLGSIGCQPTASGPNTTVVATKGVANEQTGALSTATSLVLTRPISQTVTSTSTPIPSPTSSPTPQPTLTPLPTETVTPTPWPTLPPDEAANKVLALLVDNQNPNCLLPCWWGATPGQTNWEDIAPFLNSFATKIRKTPLGASVTLPLPAAVAVSGFDYNVVYVWNESEVIHGIAMDSINISGYDAKTMVTLYGIPDEVWLRTINGPLQGVLPFQLIVVYQQKGISFRYYVDATKTDDTVTACFEPDVVELERPDLFPAGPKIYVWELGEDKEIGEISPVPGEKYYTLETKTDLTPETLYEKFTNPNEQPCIDTPADLWRGF